MDSLNSKIAEVLEAHDLYWECYIKGDIDNLSALLDDYYTQIGSVEEEVFFDKKDAIQFVVDTLDQISGNVKMLNRVTKPQVLQNLVLVSEQCDLYVKSEEEWIFYSKFRASTIFQKKHEGWKMIHQHSSLPDYKAQEGENIALEKISAENLELREAVKRRTVDLENKNRELQIEAALERVRALTMAMYSSEDVGKCVVKMFSDLTALGVDEGTRFGIGILNHDNENNQLWTARKNGDEVNMHIGNIDMASHPLLKSARQAWKEQIPIHKYVLEGEDLLDYYQILNNAPDYKIQIPIEKLPKKEIQHCFIFEHGFFYAFSPREFQPELIHITKRFSSLFEQTYRRYLDLVKAEAQAREAQIEAALERVRARTMSMQKSDELPEAATLLFQQVQSLGMPAWSAGYCIWNDDLPTGQADKSAVTLWMSSEGVLQPPFSASTIEDELFIEMRKGQEDGKVFHVVEMGGKKLVKHYQYMRTLPVVGEILDSIIEAGHPLPTFQIMHHAYFSKGFLLFITYEPVPEAHDVFKRFASVFDQTYTRFLDLQKAEAQAREAQIEAGLERVRARSMAMHRTEELQEAAEVLNNELNRLGIQKINQCGFAIYDEEKNNQVLWLTKPNGTSREEFTLPITGELILNERFEAWKKQDLLFHQEVTNKQFEEHLKIVFPQLKSTVAQGIASREMPDNPHFYCANFRYGYLHIVADDVLDNEQEQIMVRFTHVFSQTYTRFLDLQKAEAQAREAQIEAALEQVRSRSLAMHHSEEILDVCAALCEQLTKLGLDFEVVNIGTDIQNLDHDLFLWIYSKDGGKIYPSLVRVPYIENPVFTKLIETLDKKEEVFTLLLNQEDKVQYYKHLFDNTEVGKLIPQDRRDFLLGKAEYSATFSLGNHTMIGIVNYEGMPFSTEQNSILKRFSYVFNQSYTRFLDLQKAEAQARESEIQLALERVRARSLAMHRSEELADLSMELVRQVQTLGMESWFCAFNIYDDDPRGSLEWGSNGQGTFPKYRTPREGVFLRYYEAGQRGETFLVNEIGEEECPAHYEYLCTLPGVGEQLLQMKAAGIPFPSSQIDHVAFFKYGYVLFITYEPAPESHDIFKRFAKVFEQSYTRFLDLQKAEKQAREATKQASLDRVRGVISSMRSAVDLEMITPLIFKELVILDVPFIRCGVFIIHEKQELVEAYLSSPDGNSLGVLRLPYQASELTYQTVEAWRRAEIYKQHWSKEDFVQWIHQLMDQDQIQDSRTYQGAAAPPESLDLHFVPFTQGMLYVGNVSPLDEIELELVQSLAKAFSIAFARYEDFVKLEKAKAEVESAMNELKTTQSQLVQQEKLASLGQLTAGIAHEIKNPLNFVNNFSEVSIEMIEEALEEMEKGDDGDETLIKDNLEDIKSNLKKVHEHGSRANGIVTSMLQHSRGGTGKKEPTDLNALIKEYVNLSFHGMRAGKNPIDVDIVLELEPELVDFPLIKEDFSRLVINLCNNAFDAMRGKVLKTEDRRRKTEDGDSSKNQYDPKLRVYTILENGRVQIAFEDNGPGIPDEIKDKILQPFFTTKKGTEGTGLGLSITHDIVKAHGGELQVNSVPGEFTTFTIFLPV